MRFKILDQGFVTRRAPNSDTAIACGSRSVVTCLGDIVCTFMVQKALGRNDFKPVKFRSKDGGRTWVDEGFLWPELINKYSIFGSISIAPNGNCFFWGSRTKIDDVGETFWCDATQGLKQNELFYSVSNDHGFTWSLPKAISIPFAGSAEAPGALLVTSQGAWHCCYAPYNTFDPNLKIKKNHIVSLHSNDQGQTWWHNSMLKFDKGSGGAEAWIIELADCRLLGASWHLNLVDGSDFPNAYAVSKDNGRSWCPTQHTGIKGQACSLASLPDGRALFIYNQRKFGEIGVYLALVNPTETDFGIRENQIIWKAQPKTNVGHREWTNFSFGEPHVLVLPNNELLATLWCNENDRHGIYYVKLKIQ